MIVFSISATCSQDALQKRGTSQEVDQEPAQFFGAVLHILQKPTKESNLFLDFCEKKIKDNSGRIYEFHYHTSASFTENCEIC